MLAAQTRSIQQWEVVISKASLETPCGPPVTAFAYPYGQYTLRPRRLSETRCFAARARLSKPCWPQIPIVLRFLDSDARAIWNARRCPAGDAVARIRARDEDILGYAMRIDAQVRHSAVHAVHR